MTRLFARSVLGSMAVAAAIACGGSDKPAGPTGPFRVKAIPTTRSTRLGTINTFAINVVSTTYAGPIAVSVTGVPESWVVEFLPAPGISIAAGQDVNIIVNVNIPSNGAAALAGQTLTFQVTGGETVREVTAKLTVANEYILVIPAGAGDAGAHWTGAYASPLLLKAGVTLVLQNADAIPHRVHTNGGIIGFQHQDTDMPPYSSLSYVLGTGTDIIICHSHPSGTGQLTITME